MKLLILNGPNLNLLGTREPEIYGSQTFEDYFIELQFKFKDIELGYFQSNIEGEIIDKLHKAEQDGFYAVILNAGAYTHTSIGIGDAVAGVKMPVVEVHISNVMHLDMCRMSQNTLLE
jgi:3-dehydroquinate dehydratase-2